MKMTQALQLVIKDAITAKVIEFPLDKHMSFLIEEGKAKDLNKRLRWDYFWAASKGNDILSLVKSENLEDSHIDSALKSIFKGIV